MRAWAPLALWLGMIALASSSIGAQVNSDGRLWGLLSTWFPWLFGGTGIMELKVLSWLLRKAAHVVEYAVLGVAVAWALRMSLESEFVRPGKLGPEESQRMSVAVLLFGTLVALGDELHQATLALRTGSVGDALLDVLGVTLGFWLVRRLVQS